MIFVELYKNLIMNLDLTNISYLYDVILCGGIGISLILDGLLIFGIVTILIKLVTKKTIFYWMKKILG